MINPQVTQIIVRVLFCETFTFSWRKVFVRLQCEKDAQFIIMSG